MKKLNELVELAEKADKLCLLMRNVNPHTILAIAESFRALEQEVNKNLDVALAWKQRAEAAEAKLEDLASQPPVAYTDAEELDTMQKGTYADMFKPCDEYKSDPKWIPLFTRPAPAADLADLVPDEMTFDEAVWSCREKTGIVAKSFQVGWNACRAAMLRNIEERTNGANTTTEKVDSLE